MGVFVGEVQLNVLVLFDPMVAALLYRPLRLDLLLLLVQSQVLKKHGLAGVAIVLQAQVQFFRKGEDILVLVLQFEGFLGRVGGCLGAWQLEVDGRFPGEVGWEGGRRGLAGGVSRG